MRYRARAIMPPAMFALGLLGACGRKASPEDPPIRRGDALDVVVVVPEDAPPFLRMAAEDLREVAMRIVGATDAPALVEADGPVDPQAFGASTVVLAGVPLEGGFPGPVPDALADPRGESFRIVPRSGEVLVLAVQGSGPIGTAYGLYELAESLGARWYHPSETFLPRSPDLRWPETIRREGRSVRPTIPVRGFHQHTLHPIPFTDWALVARPEHREPITRYLRWLLRNRQNLLSWQLLITVDRSTWDDHARWIVAEAHRHGIRVGVVVGFADMQQNAYRLIRDLAPKAPLADRIALQRRQVREGLRSLAPIGFDFLVLSYGTSEMTKVSDAETLSWFEEATAWKREESPETTLYAWVHTPDVLKADDGVTPFFHLVLRAPPEVGTWVHTTMFYDLEHPAPVYGNVHFHHQRRCLAQSAGTRETLYFPETAWWLGFDNTVPLFLPITLFSRSHDLRQVIPSLVGPEGLEGHVTFTTGIEWGYWIFDWFVARAGWDSALDWRTFLADWSRLYGSAASEVREVVEAMTETQVRDFYREAPLFFFYLAGESEADEAGAASGLAGRPVKVPLWDVFSWDDDRIARWQREDRAMLVRLGEEWTALARRLALARPGDDPADPLLARRFFEIESAVEISAWRAEHALGIYDAVVDARAGRERAAYERLDRGRAITQRVRERVAEVEARVYRDPLDLVATPRENLTRYPYGWAWEARTAHFWQRRDDQLQRLLDTVFGHLRESWDFPVTRIHGADPRSFKVVRPEVEPGLADLLAGYIPILLLAQGDPQPGGERPVAIGFDGNHNDLPDAGSQVVGTWNGAEELWLAVDRLPIPVGTPSATLGSLVLRDGHFRASPEEEGTFRATLQGLVAFTDLLDALVATGLFDHETAWEMVAPLFGIEPTASPRPTDFPLEVWMVLRPR